MFKISERRRKRSVLYDSMLINLYLMYYGKEERHLGTMFWMF